MSGTVLQGREGGWDCTVEWAKHYAPKPWATTPLQGPGPLHHYKTLGHYTITRPWATTPLQDPGPLHTIASLLPQPTGPSSDGAEHLQI